MTAASAPATLTIRIPLFSHRTSLSDRLVVSVSPRVGNAVHAPALRRGPDGPSYETIGRRSGYLVRGLHRWSGYGDLDPTPPDRRQHGGRVHHRRGRLHQRPAGLRLRRGGGARVAAAVGPDR